MATVFNLGYKISDDGMIFAYEESTKDWYNVPIINGFFNFNGRQMLADAFIYSAFRGDHTVFEYEKANSEFAHLDGDPNNHEVMNLHLVEALQQPVVETIEYKKRGPKPTKNKTERKVKLMKATKALDFQSALDLMSVAEDGTPVFDKQVLHIKIGEKSKSCQCALPAPLRHALGDGHTVMSVAKYVAIVKYRDKIHTREDIDSINRTTLRKRNHGWLNNSPDNIYIEHFETDDTPATFDDVFGEQFAEQPEQVMPEVVKPIVGTTVPVPAKILKPGTQVYINSIPAIYQDGYIEYEIASLITGLPITVEEELPDDYIVSIQF